MHGGTTNAIRHEHRMRGRNAWGVDVWAKHWNLASRLGRAQPVVDLVAYLIQGHLVALASWACFDGNDSQTRGGEHSRRDASGSAETDENYVGRPLTCVHQVVFGNDPSMAARASPAD
jgi:hypothetical protein